MLDLITDMQTVDIQETELTIPSPAGDIYAVFNHGMTIGSGDPDLNGNYAVPNEMAGDCGRDSFDKRNQKPLVVLCHGLMMNCGQNPIMGVANIFNEAGYDTLRFDFRGSGKSSGLITEMTPLTEVNDLLSVISYVRAMGRRVILCGHSLGGLVSLITAPRLADSTLRDDYGLAEVNVDSLAGGNVESLADSNVASLADGMKTSEETDKGFETLKGKSGVGSDCKNVVEGLVLLAPAVNIEMDSKAGRVADVHFDPVNIPDEVEVWGSRLSRQYFVTAQNLNTFEVISHYKGPVCIMMGDRDRIVELNLSERILAALPQAELHTLEHGDHLFSRGVRIRAGAIAVDFCNRLGKKQ